MKENENFLKFQLISDLHIEFEGPKTKYQWPEIP